MRVCVLAVVLTLLATAGASADPKPARAEPAAQDAAGAAADGLIVKFKDGVTLGELGSAFEASDAEVTGSTGGSRLVFADAQAGQSLDDAIAELRADPNVEFAEPDRLVSIVATPNDTYYSSQWQYPQINLPAAWDITTGSDSVIVAVIDTGVLSTHPDLNDKLTTGAAAGYDYFNNDANPNDDQGHGTFVAGIIAAETNNASWVSGACWSCKIMAIKALGANGTGPTSAVVSGIDHAVAGGAQVINLSLGSSAPDPAMELAINNAVAADVVVVAASGNDNGPVLYPAVYSNVIAVGANNQAGARASFSNYGLQLDVMAPGEDVWSTVRTSGGGFGYGYGSGTSFAAPHVAGVAGLMVSAGITEPSTIASLLRTTATDMGTAGFDNATGWGRINAAAALDDSTPPAVSITSPAAGTISGTVAFNANASDGSGIQKVRFWIGGTYLGYDSAAPYTRTLNTTGVLNGKHTLKVQAIDNAGNSAVATRVVTVINADSTPPAVSITSPSNGATVSGGAVSVAANASDTQGLQKVQFWIDGTYLGYDSAAPYARVFNSGLFYNGTHTLKARAIDWGGNYTDTTITVTVDNNDPTPPTVSISAPADGATVSGTVTVTASASDNIGLNKVQFWVDGTYLGFDPSSPYTRSWNSTGVSNGPHTLRARAVDNAGNVSSDATITVTVNN